MSDFLTLLATDPFIFEEFGMSPVWGGSWIVEWLGDKPCMLEFEELKCCVIFENTRYYHFKQANFYRKGKPYGAIAIYDMGVILLKELNDVDAYSISKQI